MPRPPEAFTETHPRAPRASRIDLRKHSEHYSIDSGSGRQMRVSVSPAASRPLLSALPFFVFPAIVYAREHPVAEKKSLRQAALFRRLTTMSKLLPTGYPPTIQEELSTYAHNEPPQDKAMRAGRTP